MSKVIENVVSEVWESGKVNVYDFSCFKWRTFKRCLSWVWSVRRAENFCICWAYNAKVTAETRNVFVIQFTGLNGSYADEFNANDKRSECYEWSLNKEATNTWDFKILQRHVNLTWVREIWSQVNAKSCCEWYEQSSNEGGGDCVEQSWISWRYGNYIRMRYVWKKDDGKRCKCCE